MPLLLNDPVFREDPIGMPASHAAFFQAIAAAHKVVIVCRAPGPTCCLLLEEGYDTKGFRIHGKSCDWGPMAGFVLRDPRLNKKGDAKVNIGAHKESLEDNNHAGWRAGTVPLKIYEERVRWLQRRGLINAAPLPGHPTVLLGNVVHRSGVNFYYALFPEVVNGQRVYGVYIHTPSFTQDVGGAPRVFHPFSREYEALMAMTNPATHRSWPGDDFRNAITGDYDLFAVWPHRTIYERYGMDRRILGTTRVVTHAADVDAMEHDFVRVHGHAEATKLGNLTNRLYEICQLLNSAIGQARSNNAVPGPFPNRMVCWHSDENARPGVSDVDVPLIAFTPKCEVGIPAIADFRDFVDLCLRDDFYVTLAEGWVGPDADKPNRLPPAYFRLIPDSYFTPAGALDRLVLPAWYNS